MPFLEDLCLDLAPQTTATRDLCWQPREEAPNPHTLTPAQEVKAAQRKGSSQWQQGLG